MENTRKLLHWNNPQASRIESIQPTLIIGIVLIIILGGLTGINPLLGMMSALLLFLWVLVASRPILIVYGLVLILPLTGGLARGAVVPFLRVGQALLLLAFILFLLARSSPLGKSRLTAIDLAFALFFLSEAVFPVLALYSRGEHLYLNDTNNIYGVTPIQTLLGPLQYYLLYRIVVATISSEKQIKIVLELSFIASIIVSVIGILEKVMPSVRTFIETYYPPIGPSTIIPDYEVRIASTLQFYNGLASYLDFAIVLALACYVAEKRLRIQPLLLVTTILLSTIALVLTGTFAAWIGLAVGALVVFILFKRLPKLVIVILFGVALAALIFQPFLSARLNQQLGLGAAQGLVPQSLAFRIKLWQEIFLPAIGQHLLFGDGPAPAVLQFWSVEESQYLHLLLRGGLFYLFSYLLLIGVAMITCWRQIKSKSSDARYPVAIALLSILIALSVMNVSNEYFTLAGGAQIIWLLLAVVVASMQFRSEGSSAPVEQIQDNQLRVRNVTLFKRFDMPPPAVMGDPADSSLARKDSPFISQLNHHSHTEKHRPPSKVYPGRH